MNSKDLSDTVSPAWNGWQSAGFVRFIVLVAFAMLVGVGLFYLTMQPSAHDLVLLVELMSATTLFSVGVSYLALRLGWLFHFPRLRLSMVGSYLLAGILVFINVWVTARIMFTSQHDLLLATVLLIYASCMAVFMGLFLSEGITLRIELLKKAAQQVAEGRLATRLLVVGTDEMSVLTSSFNEMVAQLQDADRREKELDILRRDLIAWIGHDLRTPLTSIRAIVEALADGVVDNEADRSRYLNTARNDICTLSDLIDDLFEMAQMDAGGMKLDKSSVSIADLISDTLEQFSTQARQAGILLEGSAGEHDAPVFIDVRRIERVLANLVSNAIHHTPRGGTVSVEAERHNNALVVSVRDTGEGIHSDDLPHVFERFFRGEKSRNRQTGGAGLGLSIARGIVELHGGTIHVASQDGVGTTVWFQLPQPADVREAAS